MKTRIQKWGNSLAVRIPRPFAEETQLQEDSPVDISLRNGKLVVVPLVSDRSLDDLVEGITAKNRHREIETGGPVGNEIW